MLQPCSNSLKIFFVHVLLTVRKQIMSPMSHKKYNDKKLTIIEVVSHKKLRRGLSDRFQIVPKSDGAGTVIIRFVRFYVECGCATNALKAPRAKWFRSIRPFIGCPVIVHSNQAAGRTVQKHTYAVQPVWFKTHAKLASTTGAGQPEHHPQGATWIRPAYCSGPTLVQPYGPHRVFQRVRQATGKQKKLHSLGHNILCYYTFITIILCQ